MKNACKINGKIFLVLIITLGLLVAGCKSKPSKFYVLAPLQTSVKKACNVDVGVGPLSLPRYLEQPQIITRLSKNQVKLNEFHRWAEPLKSNVMRVLTRNIKQLLRARQVVSYPWPAGVKLTSKVQVTLAQFDANANGLSKLIANWVVTNNDDNMVNHGEKTYTTRVRDKPTQDRIVAAMNNNLNALSRSIARDIRRQHCQ